MKEEEIAVAIGVLDERVKTLSTSMEQAVSRIEKCIESMKDTYKDMFKDVNCRIEERIKISDANQDRLEKKINTLEKNYTLIAFIGAVLGTLALKALDYIL